RLAAHAGAARLGRARPPAPRRHAALLPRPLAPSGIGDPAARRPPAASRGSRRAGPRHRPPAGRSLTDGRRTEGGRRPTLLPCWWLVRAKRSLAAFLDSLETRPCATGCPTD